MVGLRKTSGLPDGVNLFIDHKRLFASDDYRIVFDLGAHQGESTAEYLQQFPNARVFALEPVTDNFTVLSERFRTPPVIHTKIALGDKVETTSIVLQSDPQTHSLKARSETAAGKVCEPINVSTIDRFCEETDIQQIDFLKIEVEGYELQALAGRKNILDRRLVGPILVEATLDPNDAAHTCLLSLADRLQDHGYRLVSIYDQVVWPRPSRLEYFNALFARDMTTFIAGSRSPK